MRIGLLIYGSLDTISGGYLYDRKLVAHLRAQGDHVEIISLPWRGYFSHLLDNFSRSLLQRLRKLCVDVLIQDELNHPSLARLNSKLDLPYPIISLVHHLRCEEMRPAWQNRLYRWVERSYLDSVDGFIFNSRTTQRSVDRVSKIHQRPFVIATPAGDRFETGVDEKLIKARSNQPGPLRLLFLGNLIPRKGLHTLIAALARLPEGTCRLDVVGDTRTDPAYVRTILHQVARLDLNGSIHFHAALEDSTLASLLVENQVLVLPSSYEGFGIVYLEAMSFGLPVIGTTQGASNEIIVPDENGYLIEAENAACLAAKLQNLHQDRALLASLSLSAVERYRQFPGWEQSMGKIREFLLEVSG